MQGLPKVIGTKRDVENMVEMASAGELDRNGVIAILDNLLATRQHLVIKEESAETPPDELTEDDFELVDDPNSQMARMGLTEEEITLMKGGLEE